MKPPYIGIYLAFLFCFFGVFIGTVADDAAATILNAAETSLGFENAGATSNAAISNNEANIFYACGDEDDDSSLDMKCSCLGFTLTCKSTKNDWYWDYFHSVFNHTNIKVDKKDFVVKFVDLNYFSLNSLTKDELFPGHENTIKNLTLIHSKISTIENGTFDNFANLTNLNLGYNNLKEINDAIFTSQLGSTLTKLNLHLNNIQHISSTTFQYMNKLTWLRLSYNPKLNLYNNVDGKNVTIFSKSLSNLKYLDLDGCGVSNLENDIFENLKNLEELHLSANQFTIIPTMAIKSLKNLNFFQMTFSNLRRIDDCAFCNLTKLKNVILSYNSELSYFHENAFGGITNNGSTPNLDYFTIQNTAIQILPEKLLDWKNVKRIEIHDNLFTCNCSMAWLINDLKSDDPLHIENFKDSSNRTLKHSLRCGRPSALHYVKMYTLSGNFCQNDTENHKIEDDTHVTYVCGRESTDSYCNCEKEKISCSRPSWYWRWYDSGYSEIKQIEIIDNRKNIKYAKFDNYKFKEFKKGALFKGHEKYFEELKFVNNDFIEIGNGTFDNFVSLKTLSLSNNKIKNITNAVLTSKLGSTLLELDLSYNLFTQLHSNTFIYLTKLENLSLAKNPNLNFSIPIFSAELSNLTKLDLSECAISNLTENIFSNLTSLKTLILNGNLFTSIPKAVHQFSNLRHLHISESKISVFGSREFSSFIKLETLTVTSGGLKTIENCAFCDLPNLKKVFLEENRALSFIHENAFGSIDAGIPKIFEIFSIQNSGLQILPEQLLDWNKVKLLILKSYYHYKPFTCNCSNAWLINDLKALTPKYPIFSELDLHCLDESDGNRKYFKNVPECIEEEIIYVCGDNAMTDGCTCENNDLKCQYGNDGGYANTNIRIMDENFIVKNASFASNNIKFLKKDNILPSREHEIEELDFGFNKIKSIENGTFKKFTSLKTLNLKNNALTKIDESVLTFELGQTLEKLDLSHNHLTNITNSTFENMNNLTSLSLAFNDKINFTNEEIIFSEALSNLKVLDLGGCNIHIINESIFVNLVNLEILGLYHNPITSLPKALQVLSNLRHLNIHNSKLASLNNSHLIFHPELEILDISASNISEIQDCTFCNLTKLKKVFLNQNHRLSFIHENAFGNTNNSFETSLELEIFSIEKCNVSYLPENLLDWKSLKIIRIEENPFICDCSMAWLINGLNSFETVFDEISINPFENENKLKCFNPPQFRGVHFNNISEEFCAEQRPTTTPSSSATAEISLNKTKSASYLWFSEISAIHCFVFIIFAIGIYVFCCRRTKNVQNSVGIRNENFEEDEEDKNEEDFDTNNI